MSCLCSDLGCAHTQIRFTPLFTMWVFQRTHFTQSKRITFFTKQHQHVEHKPHREFWNDQKWFVHRQKYFHLFLFAVFFLKTMTYIMIYIFYSLCRWPHFTCPVHDKQKLRIIVTRQINVYGRCFTRERQTRVRHWHSRHALQDLLGPYNRLCCDDVKHPVT